MRIVVAFQSFFAALFSGDKAEQIAQILAGDGPPPALDAPASASQPKPQPKTPPEPKPPARSEALTLLETLQREARLVDFLKESLEAASDDQIGAVVRDVHRDCGVVLERLFAIRPLLEEEEGAEVEVPAGFDAARFRLTGNVQGEPPFRGRLNHHGWQATQCELPQWSGAREDERVLAPADVELP